MASSGGSSVMQQAQQMWSMLDDMASTDPAAYRKFIDRQLAEGQQSMKPPEPHMCVRTTIQPGGDCLYLNICEWPRIPAPKTDEDPIPVMGGTIYQQKDESGSYQCVTMAFHTSVLQEYGIESSLLQEQQMLIYLAFDYVRDQYKLQLCRDYALLPITTRYKGGLDLLRSTIVTRVSKTDEQFERDMGEVQKTFAPSSVGGDSLLSQLSNLSVDKNTTGSRVPECSEPQVSLLSSDSPAKPGLIEELETRPPLGPIQPKYSLVTKQSPRQLVAKIQLPGVTSVSDCELDISQEDLSLEVDGRYQLALKLPEPILAEDAAARFSRKSHTLTVVLPVNR